MGYSLGIDVGTTFTAAAVWRDDRVEVVSLESHRVTVPSVVYANGDDVAYGSAAISRAVAQPGGAAREFKRRLGDSVPLVLSGAPYSADRLVALFVRWVVASVTEQFGEPPDHIVVTHPANWTEFQLHLLTTALQQADLGSVDLLTEPQAAAHDFGTAARLSPGELIVVYDLGGGTFDVALLRCEPDGFSHVGEAAGVERLGGIDFDEAVFQHVMRHIPEQAVGEARTETAGRMALAQLRRACVEAKESLSSEVAVEVPVVLPGHTAAVRLTRAEFEDMIRPMLGQTFDLVRQVLTSAGLSADELAAILLVGGSSRVPLVSELAGQEIGAPVRIDAHPKLVVARGAARWASSGRRAAAAPVAPPSRSRPPWLLPAAAVVAVAAIGVGALAWAAGDDGDASPDSETSLPPATTAASTAGTGSPTESTAASTVSTAVPTTTPPPSTTVGDGPSPSVAFAGRIGSAEFAEDFEFGGAQVGALSGLAAAADGTTYFAVPDDVGGDPRLYGLEIDLADGQLDDGDVEFTNVAPLLDEDAQPLGDGTDAEGLASAGDGTLFVASEGSARNAVAPWIRQFNADGTFVADVPLPFWYLPDTSETSGIRPEGGLTGLTYQAGPEPLLLTGVEFALYQDDATDDRGGDKFVRILGLDPATGGPVAEWAYPLDRIPDSILEEGTGSAGLLDLLAVEGSSTVLALERSAATGANRIRLYAFDVGATPPATPSAGAPPLLEKELVIDFVDDEIGTGRFQAMAFGPELEDGRASLILLGDNMNEGPTKFVAVALDIAQ